MIQRFSYLQDVVTLRFDANKCIGCDNCLAVCPHAVMQKDAKKVRIVARDACMECGACAQNCPTAAIRVDTGVGCAAALLNVALGRTKTACCGPTQDGGPACC